MKIGVLLKQVPDTETRIKVTPDGKGIDETGIKWIVNPYDEFAVEEAIRLKESSRGEVVIVSVGPKRVQEAIRTALAMGADRGVRVESEGTVLDNYLTAEILAKVIEEEKFDIVFGGKQAIDDDAMQVISATAGMLGWPSVSVIEKFELKGGAALVQRPLGGGLKEELEVTLPAIFGCEKDLNKPRYASLPGIMKAKSKPIAEKKIEGFIGEGATVHLEVLKYVLPPERAAGRKIQGTSEELADALVKYLRDEIKVI